MHPFDQLTPEEAKLALKVVYDANKGHQIHIKNICVWEPPKSYMIKYLDAEHAGSPIAPPPRVAYAVYYDLDSYEASQLWVDINAQKVVKSEEFPTDKHLTCDALENDLAEPYLLKFPEVQEALLKLGIPKDKWDCLSPDGWMYGCDTPHKIPRYHNWLMYMRNPDSNHPDSNIYARPLPFVVIMDAFTKEFVRIDWCATGGDSDDVGNYIAYNTRNPATSILDDFKNQDYMAELRPDLQMRDIKPYNVIQPEGPSFTIDGSLVRWQKWSFRVGFNPREGVVLYDLRFDGRMTFYRIAVNEMTVPYGDPRPPLHRKQAFDLGDIGAGYAANTLGLGCDCLGVIKYFDGTLVHGNGQIETRKNVVCMHEQDDGVLMKHQNFRTGNGRVARRRILVLQTVLTVANYEYMFLYHLDQAGNIELEIRATGVVSTQYIDPGKTTKYGMVVAPSVLAASHQHIFSMRIDPAIDGHKNTIECCDTKLVPRGPKNPHGNGFYNSDTPIERSTAFDCDQSVNRFVKIVNENKINPVSMRPIGYKFAHCPSALLMAPPGTVANNRAQFGNHHFWVTKYKDNEFYGGGVWTNQASYETGGVRDAVDRDESVRNDDVVLWHSFGLTHHVRPEDFPVMPIERIIVGLHPYGFFTENPAMDIPQSTQQFNRSVEVMDCNSCQKL